MTAHQIAILALSTLLFGMLSLQSFKRNKKAKMPLESDENYFSHTAYEIPDSKWQYIWSNFRNFTLTSWGSYLCCWLTINLYAFKSTAEGASVGIISLIIFYLKQLIINEKAYRNLHEAKASSLILQDGVCIVINPDDLQNEEVDYNKVRKLKDYVITLFIPWSKVTHVHVFSDNVAIESKEHIVQFFYNEEESLHDILQAVAPHFKKSISTTTFLTYDEATKVLTEDAGIAIYLLPYAPDSHDRPEFTSIIGGRPNLPADIAWPYHNGVPMSFLAQIRISEAFGSQEAQDTQPPLGEKGMLFFFADLKTSNRDDQESYKVIYLPDEPITPERSFPDDLSSSFCFDSIPVVLQPELGFHDYMYYSYTEGEPSTTKATYDAVINSYFQDFHMHMGHMFGGAQWKERSPLEHIEELQQGNDYFMLLQLESFDGDTEDLHPLQLGRAESIMFFYIKEKDLEQRDFTHVLVDWQ